MSDAFIPVGAPTAVDSQLDAEFLTVAGQGNKRERIQIAGALDVEIARVENAPPASTDYGMVVRPIKSIAEVSDLVSASRTTTQTQADQTNPGYRGIAVTLDMTVVGTGSVTLEIDVKDPVSGKYVALLTGAAVTTNSTNVYTLFPGAPATANVSANAQLWKTFRIKVTANNANAATYSVGYVLLP